MNLYSCDKDNFVKNITSNKADKFAKTFVAKADMHNYWSKCVGAFDNYELLGAIIVTVSKSEPKVANLQLLHTFNKHRKKGVGAKLCFYGLNYALYKHASYFRVSSEPNAVSFYKKLGFKMLGKQKSGTYLSMFRITDNTFSNGMYNISDPIINKCVFRKGKGGCVEIF